jgi:hypothetical protein
MAQVDFVLTLFVGVVIVYSLSMVVGAKRACQRADDSTDAHAQIQRAQTWLNAALVGLLISLLITAFRPLIGG